MSLITLSRETGSLGDETARLLAGKLGFMLLDRTALEETIDGEGFPDISLERFDEHSPSFWENFTSGKDVYLDRLRTAVLERAAAGKAIVLGRGSQFILSGLREVFRVRLVASVETRVARLESILECDKRTAERYCRRSDHDRNGFSRFFFGGHWADPTSYDMVVNSDGIDADQAAEMIAGAFASSPAAKQSESRSLEDRLTAQQVRNRILYVHRIPVDLLEVECDGGKLLLRGTVTVRENAKRCEEAAKEVEGVTGVETEVYFVNPVMTY